MKSSRLRWVWNAVRNVRDEKDKTFFVAKLLETTILKGLEKDGCMILRCILGKYFMSVCGSNEGLFCIAAFLISKAYLFCYNIQHSCVKSIFWLEVIYYTDMPHAKNLATYFKCSKSFSQRPTALLFNTRHSLHNCCCFHCSKLPTITINNRYNQPRYNSFSWQTRNYGIILPFMTLQ